MEILEICKVSANVLNSSNNNDFIMDHSFLRKLN